MFGPVLMVALCISVRMLTAVYMDDDDDDDDVLILTTVFRRSINHSFLNPQLSLYSPSYGKPEFDSSTVCFSQENLWKG